MKNFKKTGFFIRIIIFLTLLPLKILIKLLKPGKALEMLFHLEKHVYFLETAQAIRYEKGPHPKHRHIRYHDFFIGAIPEGSRVLDVGCGNGQLTYDIARKVTGARVTGIDIVEANIKSARDTRAAENVEYIYGDATKDLPDRKFDIITLSNVLEHIENRPLLLKNLIQKYHPARVLIRVPIFERDWRIPLQEELKIDYRLDGTHYIEYRNEEFTAEMKNAGLKILSLQVKWGEIWAETAVDDE